LRIGKSQALSNGQGEVGGGRKKKNQRQIQQPGEEKREGGEGENSRIRKRQTLPSPKAGGSKKKKECFTKFVTQ